MTISSRVLSVTSAGTVPRNARLAAVGVPPPVPVGPGGLLLLIASSAARVESAAACSVASSSAGVVGSGLVCFEAGPQPALFSGSGRATGRSGR
jgi:hypothetical protein